MGHKVTDWSWLPKCMPATANAIAVKRQEVGKAWVAECWRKGVVEGQPGWFFAVEGVLALGIPPHEGMLKAWAELSRRHPGASLLFIAPKPVEVTDGVAQADAAQGAA